MELRCCGLSAGILLLAFSGWAADGLEACFRNPPATARPQTWYHMMNGNVSKAGITRDFEALAEVGVGGVQMFDAGCDIPPGPLQFNTPAWFDLLVHAVHEAKRLGLEVVLPNCSGWSSSGGPWISNSNAMKRVAFTESAPLTGPARFSGTVAAPVGSAGWRSDVATLAIRVPSAECEPAPAFETSYDGMNAVATGQAKRRFAGFWLRGREANDFDCYLDLVVEASDGGAAWRTVQRFDKFAYGADGSRYREGVYLPFDAPVEARDFRLAVKRAGYGRFTGVAVFEPRVGRRISCLGAKVFECRQNCRRDVCDATPDQVVRKEDVIDLTSRLTADGRLDWDVPEGTWRILRFAAVLIGRKCHPASKGGEGLEVDKFDAAALDFHFESYIGKLCRMLDRDCVGADRPGLCGTLVDSYEVGCQNWTWNFDRAFAVRTGYDLRGYLPLYAGYIVGSLDESECVLDDIRRVSSQLFSENYAGALRRKCRQYGLKLSLEPYGSCPADWYEYGRFADIPMSEFWSGGQNRVQYVNGSKAVSALPHFWGGKIVGAEAFTANIGSSGRLQTTPYAIKAQGDLAFASGVNRIIYHRFVHQPWADRDYAPGMTMGKWGMCFDRTQTWWYDQKEWIHYQTRCQALLQAGDFRADAFVCRGDAVPNGTTDDVRRDNVGGIPEGFDFDEGSGAAVRALRVEDGRLVSPGGTRYRVLVVARDAELLPETKAAIASLRATGATVCTAGETAVFDRLTPDVVCQAKYPDFSWIHRGNDEAEWYFLARANKTAETLSVSFRQKGKAVELWDAETGEIVRARRVTAEGDRTRVEADLRPFGSVFVVFRQTSSAPLERETKILSSRAVEGPWNVVFGADSFVFTNLVDWTKHPDKRVNYFSGTAVYEKEIDVVDLLSRTRTPDSTSIVLDLGEVKHFATVTVNGKTYPTMWRPPFRLDITDAVKGGKVEKWKGGRVEKWKGGMVELSVRVTNLWPNRMIGDERECAPDCEWQKNGGIVAIPDWVKRGEKSPTGRTTFATWHYWKADEPLMSSGLLGPVALQIVERK